jgi:hypothetical protein
LHKLFCHKLLKKGCTIGITPGHQPNPTSTCCSWACPQVLFWDVRVDKLLKKGNKRMDDAELVWKPMHSVHLLSVAGEGGRRDAPDKSG